MRMNQTNGWFQLIGHQLRAMQTNPFDKRRCLDQHQVKEILALLDWFLENSIVLGSGSHLGLYVILNANISDYFCSSTESAGFKILLHNPTETPRISDYGLLVSTGRQTRVFVSPKINTASYLVKKVPPSSRRCYFPNEMKLDFFRYFISSYFFNANFKMSLI